MQRYENLKEELMQMGSPEDKVRKWKDVEKCFYEEVLEKCPEVYEEMIEKLYVLLYGCHFNKNTAEKAVQGMVNNDGTMGPHWSLEQTNQLAQRASIIFSKDTYNEYDWYYTLNMVYSDYYGAVQDDTMAYMRVAKAFLEDKDAKEGKAYRYYTAMKD